LESCFPQNKRLMDKIGLDPNLPGLIRAIRLHAPGGLTASS
jgi:hypothetical protein